MANRETFDRAFLAQGDGAWVQLPGDPVSDLRAAFAELERRESLPPEPFEYVLTPTQLCRLQSIERERGYREAFACVGNRQMRRQRRARARRRRGDHETP